MKFLPVLFFFILSSVFAQKIEVPVNHRVVLNQIDHVIYADILSTDQEIDPDLDLYYYWFKANDIKRTRGGYDGSLLHGTYMEFYPDKDLKEKGEFRYGLKHGLWKTWFPGGELASIIKWKKGKLSGDFKLFNEEGELIKEGCYKNDELHGKLTTYLDKGDPEVCRYKKGKIFKAKDFLKFKLPFFKRNGNRKDTSEEKNTEIKKSDKENQKPERKRNKKERRVEEKEADPKGPASDKEENKINTEPEAIPGKNNNNK